MKRPILLVLGGLLLWLAPHLSPGRTGISSNLNIAYLTPFIGIRVNDGNQFTNSTKISIEIRSLQLKDSIVTEMQIGIMEDLSGVEWIPYSTEKYTLNISSGDGKKFVYARLKDQAGNASPIERASIILDTKPPEKIEIAINRGQKYTKDIQRRAMVFILTEEEDIKEMMLCNKSDFLKSEWEPFSNSKRWILSEKGGDGEKSVYMKFRDKAGNESLTFWTNIIMDTQPPENGSKQWR